MTDTLNHNIDYDSYLRNVRYLKRRRNQGKVISLFSKP